MESKKTPTQYKNEFQRDKYDRIALQVQKGKRDEIRKIAESKGLSLNAYIKKCIQDDSGLEL